MVFIVDRRNDSPGKSTVNRNRFMRRFKGQIRKAVSDSLMKRSVRDLKNGEKVSIPAKGVQEHQFQHGRGGIWDNVLPGNDRFVSGDQIKRPSGGGAGGTGKGKASDTGEGEDDFVFQISRQEFFDLYFDDMELPHLIRTQLAHSLEHKMQHAGIANVGTPTNLHLVRTRKQGIGRRIGMSASSKKRLAELEAELKIARDRYGEESPQVQDLLEKIALINQKIDRVPFIDTFDLRYNFRAKVPKPTTAAVMFCIMDVSGSMDEEKKTMAKRFFMLLYLFLTSKYEFVDVIFIRHHTTAKECDEEEFFYSRETGGTVVSPALELTSKIIRDRYPQGSWNVYAAHASDGDNWDNDSPVCRSFIAEEFLPLLQYYAYIEIADTAQNLWNELVKITSPKFAMKRVKSPSDIYPVLHELFKKGVV